MLYEETTSTIIKAAHEVHRVLGFGFLEAVYGNALYKELTKAGIRCECQKAIDVFYKGDIVGHYVPDMIVEEIHGLGLHNIPVLNPCLSTNNPCLIRVNPCLII
jgi:GxxExxY protein